MFARARPAFWAGTVWWLFLVIVGIAFIALAPQAIASLEAASASRSFRNLGVGLLSLAAVLGLVPVAAITLIGILLLPFVLLFIVITCAVGYVAGVFLAGSRFASAFFPINSNGRRVEVLVVAMIVAGLLGTIPFLGWLIGLALLAYGLGAISIALMGGSGQAASPRGQPQAVAGTATLAR